MRQSLVAAAAVVFVGVSSSGVIAQDGADTPKLIELMADELDYTMANLVSKDGVRPYFLAYSINDVASESMTAQLGAIYADNDSRRRILDVDMRIGDYTLDNTHKIRGRGAMFPRGFGMGSGSVSIEDNDAAIRHALWKATDRQFKSAIETYQQVQTNVKTMVEEEEKADDFSRESPSTHFEGDAVLDLDHEAWAARVRAVSELALQYPLIYSSSVSLGGTAENRYMVSSEGTRLKTQRKLLRVAVTASTKAEDGMDLSQTYIFSTATEDGLPSEDEMLLAFQGVIDMALALREAPLVEPYTGPAILMNRASGVFFHEIFGHRIEGHRQKDVDEGQTFTKMVGKPILPDFISVCDDPTLAQFSGEDLRGFYRYDDEGVPAMRVDLVGDGVLNTFLLSRSPVAGFDKSNGHGRRSPGSQAVSRQGNLMVQSSNVVEFKRLRAMLVEECNAQGKPFGFLFQDITGGFTTTGRGGPQAFKVLPVVVYRVYTDGRPDELVRGVDIVGTPLSCFSQIICTADDPSVFNGTCGAESGWVPVSAVSPSILVRQIEIEKRQRSQDRPPLLSPPIGGSEPSARSH